MGTWTPPRTKLTELFYSMPPKLTKSKQATQPKTETAAPVLLYPLHGCQDVQMMTAEERVRALRVLRNDLRKHWNHPGVKALVGVLEFTTHAMTQDAIAPGATVHQQGQAWAGSRMLASLRAIVTGEEDDS